jgi:hypothetical protein
MYRGTKGIFFLMYLFVLPMILEMPLILALWLKNIPEFLVLFTRLGLLEALVSSVSYTMNAAIMATGRMKQYQLTIGIIILLNFPFSLIALLPGGPPYSVMIVGVCLSFMYSAARLLIAKVLTGFSILDFLIKVILPLMMMAASSACVTVLLWHGLTEGIFRLVIITAVSLVASSLFMYLLGISKNERYMLKKYFANTIFKRSEVVL